MDRILLGQLGANGDCLYATILARQLRHDYPNAEITWAVSSQCKGLLAGNPHVDSIWEVPIRDWSAHDTMWQIFEAEALRRFGRRQFDHVLLSQIWPNNFQNFDGTVRPSILRSYGRHITVPIENVLVLAERERARVDAFARRHRLRERRCVIVFECSAKSGQSFVTPDFAKLVVDHLLKLVPDVFVIYSTHLPMRCIQKQTAYGGILSLRETAYLTHFADLFVGAGSGGTVAASSLASKPLPMLLLLEAATSVFASFAHDFEYFGLERPPIAEISSIDASTVASYIAEACDNLQNPSAPVWHEKMRIDFSYYCELVETCLFTRHRFIDAALSLFATTERYGWDRKLRTFALERVIPNLPRDPAWFFSDNRMIRDDLVARIQQTSTDIECSKQSIYNALST